MRRNTLGEDGREQIDPLEVFEHIRDINDPEHPYTLEQLNVITEDQIQVDDERGRVRWEFLQTIAVRAGEVRNVCCTWATVGHAILLLT